MSHKINTVVCNPGDFIKPPTIVNTPNCNNTTTPVLVDQVVASYTMNPHHYFIKEVHDVITATISGQITGSIAGTVLTIGSSLVTYNPDVPLAYLIDFGTGFTDVINPTATSTQDFTNQPSGKYEVKVYVILKTGNILVIGGIELNWNGTVLSFISTSPFNVNRSYFILNQTYLQRYCDSSPIGSGFLADGTAYTPIGTPLLSIPVIRDERFSEADVTLNASGSSSPTAVTPTYSTNRTLQTANTTPAPYNIAVPANTREITIQNITNADVQVTTSQGNQIVATRGVITLANPLDTTINHNVFTGNITITFLSNVGGNIGGVAPRVITNIKSF